MCRPLLFLKQILNQAFVAFGKWGDIVFGTIGMHVLTDTLKGKVPKYMIGTAQDRVQI
jgi:hypothetical protein